MLFLGSGMQIQGYLAQGSCMSRKMIIIFSVPSMVIKGVAKLPEIRQKGKDNKKRHGDSGIAGAMAWFATRQEWGGAIEFASTGKTNATAGRSMSSFLG